MPCENKKCPKCGLERSCTHDKCNCDCGTRMGNVKDFTKACPKCGTKNHKAAEKCLKCGTML